MKKSFFTLLTFCVLSPGFSGVQKRPTPLGGFEAINGALQYPENTLLAGIGGRVIIRAFVDSSGNVTETEVLQSPDSLLTEAAAQALRSIKWQPAKFKSEPIGDWVVVPVIFLVPTNGPDRKAAERTFVKRHDFWVQKSYDRQTLVRLKTDSKKWLSLIENRPSLASIPAQLGPRVVFESAGKRYKVTAGK